MGKHERLTGAERVARRRAALRAQGLRPKQFWLPNLRDPKVQKQIEAEVSAINASEDEATVMAWIDSLNTELLETLPPYEWGEQGPPTRR